MKATTRQRDSSWSLYLDLVTAKTLVWVATAGRDAQLTPQAHLYFFHLYGRLAEHHRAHGRSAKAKRLAMKAHEHYLLSGGDGPPYAAAMAMPRPRRFVQVDAVGKQRFDSPDDAA